jgi:8-oxo-dGTP pyrophosphatase MutT (NUDIX family)
MTSPVAANPRPASTVVVLRDAPRGPEVFLVRRHEDSPFMGGAHVFPGGRVDAADRAADASWCDGLDHAARQLPELAPADGRAFHVAAARELFEEAGVLLARTNRGEFVSLAGADAHDHFRHAREAVHGAAGSFRSIVEREQLRLAIDALILFAHWVTPPIDTRQFDTRFFLTRVPPQQTPAHDDTETTHSVWITPGEAVRQAIAGEIILPPPTWTTLRELDAFATVEAALAWGRQRRIVRREPHVLELDGRRLLLLPGDPLHPDPPDGELPIETRFVFVERGWRAERADT